MPIPLTVRSSPRFPVAGTPAMPSLNAVAATGVGISYNLQRAFSNWEVQVVTTGSPTFSLQLQGSLDGLTFVNIGSAITTTGLTNVTGNTPLTMVRLNLTALSGGTLTGVIAGTESPAGSGGGGGGGAATIADGADTAEGATTDAKVTGDNAGTISAKLRGLNYEVGDQADAAATTDTGTFSLMAFVKRLLSRLTTLLPQTASGLKVDNSAVIQPVSAVSLPLPTGAAADASIGTTNTEIGGLTETAPATDTASSGLNGRLQRVAQRLTSLIALFPSALVSGRLDVNVGATVTPANVALDATVSTTNTEIGGLTETAPATDTASSGLNGRLQRVAQRLTSLIALLPTALISNRLDVNLGAAPATVTVQGTAASGAAIAGNPVPTGVYDGTNVQYQRGPLVSTANSSTATLLANAVFTGTGEDVSGYGSVTVLVASDVSSAAAGLSIQFSSDNTNWDYKQTISYTAQPAGNTFVSNVYGKFFRVVYTNGGTNQAAFRLQSIYHPATKLPTVTAATILSPSNFIPQYLLTAGLDSSSTVRGMVVNGGADGFNNALNGLYTLAQPVLSSGGGSSDRMRNNVDVTLLSSAARTTTQTSADIVTYNAHSLILTLDMTVIGTASVTVTINYKDPASGKYILLLSGAAVVTNSTNTYTINQLGLAAVANVSARADLGRILQVVVTANNANSGTYSVGYTLVS